jgi:hypothetical protein
MEPVFTWLATEANECLVDTFSRDLRYGWGFGAKTNVPSLCYEKNGLEKFREHTFMLRSDAQIDWLMKMQL